MDSRYCALNFAFLVATSRSHNSHLPIPGARLCIRSINSESQASNPLKHVINEFSNCVQDTMYGFALAGIMALRLRPRLGRRRLTRRRNAIHGGCYLSGEPVRPANARPVRDYRILDARATNPREYTFRLRDNRFSGRFGDRALVDLVHADSIKLQSETRRHLPTDLRRRRPVQEPLRMVGKAGRLTRHFLALL